MSEEIRENGEMPQEEPKEGAPDWMVTFGDLMTLLLCFFVLLLSFSETDRAKYKEVAGSMEKAFGIQRKTPAWDSPKGTSLIARSFDKEFTLIERQPDLVGKKIKEKLDDMFRVEIDSGSEVELEVGTEVDTENDQVIIRLLGETTFDSGSARIRSQMAPVLRRIGGFLKKTQGEIIVAGHTDDVPVAEGLFESNLGLSSARSSSVADFLIRNRYLPADRLISLGFGASRPFESNRTAAGRRKNRRVEIILTQIPHHLLGER